MIRVGDEVVYCDDWGPANTFVVTKVYDSPYGNFISGFDSDGASFMAKDADNWKPTGRYFPEVEELLKKMKENTNDSSASNR